MIVAQKAVRFMYTKNNSDRWRWWGLPLGTLLAVTTGACFSGEFVQGLPCTNDADCGAQLRCVEGLCGGPGARSLCGNGLLDEGEDCDDGNLSEEDACTPSCRLPVCGDGFLGPGEECDDGNLVDGDTCAFNCRFPGACGDGEVGRGEECDDGNLEDGDACTPACLLPVCGDGFLALGEECDDGNDIATDACLPTCKNPVCGDGFVYAQEESCDDGNEVEVDACTTLCTHSPEAPVLELTPTAIKNFEFHWAPTRGAEWYELFEQVDAGEAFVQVGEEIEGESFSMTVPLHFRLHARYKLRACNTTRCVESPEVAVAGAIGDAVGYFKASNTGTGDFFGGGEVNYLSFPTYLANIALSSDARRLVVGAPNEDSSGTGVNNTESDPSGHFDSGTVYMFSRNSDDDDWELEAYIKASNTGYKDMFGASVALSGDGNTLAVGAHNEGSAFIDDQENDLFDGAGAVYMFEWSGEEWVQQAYLKADWPFKGDRFGWSVALSHGGERLGVGAPYELGGAIYVFERSDNQWEQQDHIKASNPEEDDFFGSSIALSGDGETLVAGAFGEDGEGNSVPNSGAVYTFSLTGSEWKEDVCIKASQPVAEDLFGFSVALSEDGETLAVGAGQQGLAEGAAYVFTRTGEMWTEQALLKASNPSADDRFGAAVALSENGHVIAVGAPGQASSTMADETDTSAAGAGAAYVFSLKDGAWEQQSYLKSPHAQGGDFFGNVALSADASTLAVGAYGENYGTSGIGNKPAGGAFDSGAVFLY